MAVPSGKKGGRKKVERKRDGIDAAGLGDGRARSPSSRQDKSQRARPLAEYPVDATPQGMAVWFCLFFSRLVCLALRGPAGVPVTEHKDLAQHGCEMALNTDRQHAFFCLDSFQRMKKPRPVFQVARAMK